MLQRGDQYILRAGQLICRTDFEKELYMMQSFGGMDQRCEFTIIANFSVTILILKNYNTVRARGNKVFNSERV